MQGLGQRHCPRGSSKLAPGLACLDQTFPTCSPPVRSNRVPDALSSPLFRILHTFSMLVPAAGVEDSALMAMAKRHAPGFKSPSCEVFAACRMASGSEAATIP